MGLKTIDGLRSYDHANAAMDVPQQVIAAGSTVNGNIHDMAGFGEFLAHCLTDAIDVGATLTYQVQESDTQTSGDFTDISGASKSVAGAGTNQYHMISVDWTHPDRKRYARVECAVTGANNATPTVVGNKIKPMSSPGGIDLTTGDNVVEVTA